MHLLRKLLAGAALPALLAFPQSENAEFSAASTLRTQGKHGEAALAFEALAEKYKASPRLPEALVQAGVARFEHARTFQMLHRNPPQGVEQFTAALAHFDRVLREFKKHPVAGRAQYMLGSTWLFLGDVPASENAYDLVLVNHKTDAKYVPKALLRRAELRAHMLRPAEALADYRKWKQDYPAPASDADAAKADLDMQYLALCERAAPALELAEWIQGAPRTLQELRGSVVGLFFFDVECHNCPKEIPFLQDLRRRYQARGFELLAIANSAKGATAAVVRDYVKEHAVDYPVALDARKTFDAYDALLAPNLVLLDKHGRVRWHEHPGNLADWTLETLLAEPALAQSRPAVGSRPPAPVK